MTLSDRAIDTSPEESSERPKRRSLKRAVLTWGVWRASLTIWGFAIWRLGLISPQAGREWLHGFQPTLEGPRAALIDIWLRWDTVHYLRIIQDGYGPDERSAFFPLYPLLGKGLGVLIGGDHLLGLLLVSNLAAIGCFYLLDQLSHLKSLQSMQHPVLHNLVFYPSAIFLFVAYPQSLVLFFSLAAYLTLRTKKSFLPLIFGFAAGLTHPTALPLAVLLFVDSYSAEKKSKLWIPVTLGPMLGIASFLAWRIYTGLPSYQEVQWAMSGRSIGLGIDLQGLMTPWTWLIRGWPNLLALLMGIGAIYWAYRRRFFSWSWFLVILLLIPIVSAPGFEPLDGLARYMLVGFPVYFALSSWLPQGWKRLGLLSLAVGANMYLCGLFILWGFIG